MACFFLIPSSHSLFGFGFEHTFIILEFRGQKSANGLPGFFFFTFKIHGTLNTFDLQGSLNSETLFLSKLLI